MTIIFIIKSSCGDYEALPCEPHPKVGNYDGIYWVGRRRRPIAETKLQAV